MRVLQEGVGELLGWLEPDEARRWMSERKNRKHEDKIIPLQQAVERFTNDGDYFALGGFGHVRVSMAARTSWPWMVKNLSADPRNLGCTPVRTSSSQARSMEVFSVVPFPAQVVSM